MFVHFLFSLLFASSFKKIEEEIKNLEKKEAKKEKKQILSQKWYTSIKTIKITDQVSVIEFLSQEAKKLGLRLQVKVEDFFINYEVINKTFIEIIAEIAQMHELKITIHGDNAIVEKDANYMVNYSIPFLSIERSSQVETEINEGSEKLNSNSKTKISQKSESNLFQELRKNIELLLNGQEDAKFFINQQSGIVTVVAKQKIQKLIYKYISQLKKQLSQQVLVEASIYEVDLNDEFEFGIDWSVVGNMFKFNGINPNNQHSGATIFNIGNNFVSMLKVLGEFGKVKSLSNPRLLIMNNQMGIFKAIENKIYFKIKKNTHVLVNQPQNGQNNQGFLNETSSEINFVPIGLSMSVQVSKMEDGRIHIFLKPTISDVSKEVKDPGIGNNQNPVVNLVPQIRTRELDTNFIVNDSEAVVIGGLIINDYEKKLRLFGYKYFAKKKEIVILLKAKNIEFEENVEEYAIFVS